MTVADLEAEAWRKYFREAEAAEEQRELAAMTVADLEGEAWRAAAAWEIDEAGTPVGGLESQGLAEALNPPLYGMEAIMAGTAYEEGPIAGSAQEVDEADTEELQQQQQQARRRQDMLSRLRLCPHRPRKHDFERRLQGAERLSALLRKRVTLPAEMETHRNWQDAAVLLPRVSCAFRNCPWVQDADAAGASADSEDHSLREHIVDLHKKEILDAAAVEDDEEKI